MSGVQTGQRRVRPGDPAPAGDPPMAIQTANALVTGSPITDEQLHAARAHFKLLSDMLLVSGPRFANPARDAVGLHNKAIQRLRESMEQQRERAMKQQATDAGLAEIEV